MVREPLKNHYPYKTSVDLEAEVAHAGKAAGDSEDVAARPKVQRLHAVHRVGVEQHGREDLRVEDHLPRAKGEGVLPRQEREVDLLSDVNLSQLP